MLTCALIVWLLQPIDWDETKMRKTFLTKSECLNNANNNYMCIKIDKRKQLTYKELEKDNCSLSDHKWSGI